MIKLGLAIALVFPLLFSACNASNENKSKEGTEIQKQGVDGSEADSNDKQDKADGNLKNEGSKGVIYTSFFPVHDVTKRIVGDKWELRSIMEVGDEPHGFELKTRDMAELSKADLIVYNGANMESFIDDLKDTVKDDNKFLDLSQGLTLLETEGPGHSLKDIENEKVASEVHDNVNPHTWLSIKNAIEELDTVYRKVSSLDPENEEFYRENLEKSQKEFQELDKKFEETLRNVPEDKKYFVVSHAAFNYLANDYGLKQVAVTGLSPEDEPSAQQLKEISDFVKSHKINTIFFEGKATPKVAETLAKETKLKTDSIYTMETVSEEEAELGYLVLMERNLEALMRAFNG